jgi:hypothetical protein
MFIQAMHCIGFGGESSEERHNLKYSLFSGVGRSKFEFMSSVETHFPSPKKEDQNAKRSSCDGVLMVNLKY